jgi:hypothetical protein
VRKKSSRLGQINQLSRRANGHERPVDIDRRARPSLDSETSRSTAVRTANDHSGGVEGLRAFALWANNALYRKGDNTMSMAEREQGFEPLSRRETIQRISAALAIVLVTFIMLVIIGS